MYSLHIFNEVFTNGLSYQILDLISVGSVLCGILVIISKNPIVSVLFLIGLFLNIACYLMMLGLNFIGLSYLLVYVGAVSILFLFILMLINVRISELTSNSSNSIPLAIFITVFFNTTLYNLLPSNITSPNAVRLDVFNGKSIVDSISRFLNLSKDNDIMYVTSNVWDGMLAETSHITSIGNVIYTTYPLWLLLTSIILLLAMVGAIVITIKQ